MVYLSRIYTKTGDQGETALGDGSRVPKDHLRVSAYGTVDELNAVLGILVALDPPVAEAGLLRGIQNDLFDLGADFAVPEGEARERLRIRPEQIEPLERAIDRLNEKLHPLTSFILPGGTPAAAWCHLARTVCRRAEREAVTLARQEKVNQQAIIYLNRLSDLLFVLARVYNANGTADVLWVPGQSQQNRPPTAG